MRGNWNTRRSKPILAEIATALAGHCVFTAQELGVKWLCVVVKYMEHDAFVVTACLTDKPKAGEDLCPTK